MQLTLEPLTAEAFAPFGRIIGPPASGAETMLHALLDPSDLAAAEPCVRLATHAPTDLPFSAPKMERHEHTEQLFLPVGEARLVIAASLPMADGSPDLSTLRGFVATSPLGFCYSRDIWHLPITVLDRPTRLLMMMLATGDPAIDTSWATLPEPLEPQPAS